MEENKQYISLEEHKILLEREKDVYSRKGFNDFLSVLDPLDDDYKFHPPYGQDDVCIKLGKMESLVRGQALANGPDIDENFTPVNIDKYEGFLKIRDSIYFLLEKIRDRKMNEGEYTSLLNETHSIYKEINDLMEI